MRSEPGCLLGASMINESKLLDADSAQEKEFKSDFLGMISIETWNLKKHPNTMKAVTTGQGKITQNR